MIFPYISQIQVNNCYTFKDFSIPNKELKDFKHIVLTGRNGSGKTTILKRIAFLINELRRGRTPIKGIRKLEGTIEANPENPDRKIWEQQLNEYADIELKYLEDRDDILIERTDKYIFSYFQAQRKVNFADVDTVTTEGKFIDNLKGASSSEDFASMFKQYLVNKKIYEAFDYMNSNQKSINQSRNFFRNLEEILKRIFHDEDLKLEFIQEDFEFFLKLGDKRKVTFNQLSEGFSAFLSIIMDLLIRTDLIKKSNNDYSFDPEGIVLIDEPETHFHLAMQYEVLPLISELFPKIQLIIATHSPAIISSIKNAIIYDLTSRDEVSGWVLGSSFSELMISHFGLENEFSPIADRILYLVNIAVKEGNSTMLKDILYDNENYLTPSLKLEIESQIIAIESKKKND